MFIKKDFEQRILKFSTIETRYFFTLSYLFLLFFKICLSSQYLSSVDNHYSILFIFPFSIILASFDFMFLFIFFRTADLFSNYRCFKYLFFVFFVSGSFFLLYDFSIYQYFRGFTNYGLSEFLAYDSSELASYFIFSLNPFLIAVILFSFFLIFLATNFTFRKKTPVIKPFSDRIINILFATNLVFAGIVSFVPFNYTVRMDKNPFWEYAVTTIFNSFHLSEEMKNINDLPRLSTEKNEFPPVNFKEYEKTKGKNVILIVLESIAFEKTPLGNDKNSPLFFLNGLAEKSFNFTSFRTFFPATTRSILGMLCSGYPGTGYRSVTNTDSEFDCNSIVDAFKQNNYDTSYFSPVLLDFDRFGESKIVKKFDFVFEPSEILKAGTFKRKFGTKTAIEEEIVQNKIFERIVQMKKQEKPFFIFYFPYWTHAPYEHPFKSSRGLNSLERYYQAQEYMNESMEAFFQNLERHHVLEETIVIITSDHGEAFGRKTGNYIHPNYLYDENLKVPFLIYIKGITDKSPKVINNPVTTFDLAPTISDLTGINRMSSWQGNNMFEGKSAPVLIYTRAMELQSGILDGNYKYFFNHVTEEEYFFDLKNDPMEGNNLADTLDDKTLKELKNMCLHY